MSVRSVRKRLVRATCYFDHSGPKSQIVLAQRFRGMNRAIVVEDGVEKTVYFRILQNECTPDEIATLRQRSLEGTCCGNSHLKAVDTLLRRPDTKFIRGRLLEGNELYGTAFIVSEKLLFCPLPKVPLVRGSISTDCSSGG